jgi:hypothetical protein
LKLVVPASIEVNSIETTAKLTISIPKLTGQEQLPAFQLLCSPRHFQTVALIPGSGIL